MATPRRTSRVGSVVSDALSSTSSPDPLNASIESAAWPSARRMTRSATRSQQTRSFVSLGGTNSPRKQTFHLDLGNGTKTPSKLRVTVETETSELGNDSIEEYKDVKRTLFNATPTPKRKRASSTTTTTVPLRDEDAPGAITPKRRGRPPRAATPMKQTPGRKRSKLSPTPEEEAEIVERLTPKPNTRKTKKAAGTPKPKGTPGRKRKSPFVPKETITYASPSPPKRARTSASSTSASPTPDFGGDDASVASSDFRSEPAENTIAQEDFSMIVADSIYSLRDSIQQQETQELGEATSLIIENALEELRQSRGEGQSQIETAAPVEQAEEEVAQLDEAQVEEETDLVIAPVDEARFETEVDPVTVPANEAQFEEEVGLVTSPVSGEVVEEAAHETSDHIDEQVIEEIAHETTTSVKEVVTELAADETTSPVNEAPAQEAGSDGNLSDNEGQDEEPSRSRSFGLNYEDFSSSVATKRRSSPRAMSSPIRLVKDVDVYEDSFSEIPQEILDAAAPSGIWPPEHRLNDSPSPPRLAPPIAATDLGARPSLSPIVRVGRALQSVTSDDASPQARQNSLGSPFRPTRNSTPVQRETTFSRPAVQAVAEDDDIWAIEADRASNGSLGQPTPVKDNNPESELSEYSMLASSAKKQPSERRGLLQSIDAGNKRGRDMADFFSSPALLPGAENAQAVLERKRLEMAQQNELRAEKQPYVLPTTTMFPSERRHMPLQADSPMTTASTQPEEQVFESSPVKPATVDPFVVETAERNRAVYQGKMAFRGSLARAKAVHVASGNDGPLPAFAVDLAGVQLPQAFKAPVGADYSTFMTTEELEKWSRDPANIISSSPTGRLRYRSVPNKYASPTKSCLRSPTKPHTPGPRLQWGSDVLSPEAQAEKRAEKRTKELFLNDFQQYLYNPEFHEEFATSSPEKQSSEPEPVQTGELEDIEMTDAYEVANPEKPEAPLPARNQTAEDEWSDPEWKYLRQLFEMRSKGQFPVDFIPADFEPRSHWLLGHRMRTHGESVVFNAWHISIIDAFMATSNCPWSEEHVAFKVASIVVHKQLRREQRDPKKPYRHRMLMAQVV